jgi:hypothetical protein
MAVLNRNSEKKTTDVSRAQAVKSVGVLASADLNKREMKISFPSFGRVIVSALEFAAFAVVAGVGCWGLAYAATELVAMWV